MHQRSHAAGTMTAPCSSVSDASRRPRTTRRPSRRWLCCTLTPARLRRRSSASAEHRSIHPDEAYAERLRRRVDELGLEQAVQFAGNVPYAAMPAEYRRTAVCLHTSRTGSLDKAALEPPGPAGCRS